MGHGALLLGVALCGCSSMLRAPGALSRQDEENRTLDETAPAASADLTQAQLARLIEHHLGQLANALEPLCGSDCGLLEAEPYPELDRAAALRGNKSLGIFLVLYQPAEFRSLRAYSETLALYALAHEMGHYVDIAIAGGPDDDPWREELAADTVAGCAFAALGIRVEIVHSLLLSSAAPVDSVESQVELTCGSDGQHPATRWSIDALDTGMRLCEKDIAPLQRLEAEVSDLTQDARRAAAIAKARLPPGDPCRWRDANDSLRRKR